MDVAKWITSVEGKRGKSLIPSTIITLAIVAMLVLSGPVQAVAVGISGLQETYTKGNDIDFQVKIEINDPDKYVPVTNISLEFAGPVEKKVFFNLDGEKISGDCNIEIEPVSIPESTDVGYGSGYGYDSRTGYGYDFGYGYGYGYGYGGGGGKISFIYNVSINTATRCLPAGNYSVIASLNTGKNVAFRSPAFSFTLLPAAPGGKIKAMVDIKPETINLGSKGKFTAFIRLPEGHDVRDIDVSTLVVEGAHAVKSMISKDNGGTLIAKFNTQDLNVRTGNDVVFTVRGEVNGKMFEGSDTVRVIKGQKDDCVCDDDEIEDEHGDHENEHDHEDECGDSEHDDEQGHNEKPVKEQKAEKDKKDNKKTANGGKGKIVVVNNNNINIVNNTGTITITINNQDSGINVGHGSNDNEKNSGNKRENRGNNNKKK